MRQICNRAPSSDPWHPARAEPQRRLPSSINNVSCVPSGRSDKYESYLNRTVLAFRVRFKKLLRFRAPINFTPRQAAPSARADGMISSCRLRSVWNNRSMTEASCPAKGQLSREHCHSWRRGFLDTARHDALPKQLAFKGKESHAERDAAQSMAQARARAAFARLAKKSEYSQAMHLQALVEPLEARRHWEGES